MKFYGIRAFNDFHKTWRVLAVVDRKNDSYHDFVKEEFPECLGNFGEFLTTRQTFYYSEKRRPYISHQACAKRFLSDLKKQKTSYLQVDGVTMHSGWSLEYSKIELYEVNVESKK